MNIDKIQDEPGVPATSTIHWRNLIFLIRSDLHRYMGKHTAAAFVRCMLLKPGFVYSFWMRLCAFLYQNRPFRYTLLPFAFVILRHFSFRFGIAIPFNTKIGPGLFIGHFSAIVVHPDAAIGRNLNISQGVTIGQSSRGKRQGVPVVGDNVYIGPGAKVIGRITIGNDVAIGANAVVTHDVPDHAVVVGIPAQVISLEGAQGYVEFTDYES